MQDGGISAQFSPFSAELCWLIHLMLLTGLDCPSKQRSRMWQTQGGKCYLHFGQDCVAICTCPFL